jgi:hypothetical protein
MLRLKIACCTFLIAFSGCLFAQTDVKPKSRLIPAGIGISPGQFSYHTLNINPYQRIPGYTLGARALVFWENDDVRFGPIFFGGTTRFNDQVNTNRRFFPGTCTDCHYFTGSRREIGGGGMFETNLDIDRGLWSFFKPLFGSEITFVRIQQEISSSYYFQGRRKTIPPVNYIGKRNFHEIRLGFYLGAEAKLTEVISIRVTSSLDISAKYWTLLPLGSFLFIPLPTQDMNFRLSPLHSLMICCRLK